MTWRNAREPKGFVQEVKDACGGLRRHAHRLELRAKVRTATRPDMIQARLRAAKVLRAMADFGEARLFEEFEGEV